MATQTEQKKAAGNGAGDPARAAEATRAAVSPAQARRDRALAQIAAVPEQKDPTTRYTLPTGEQWHDLPTGGKVAVTVTDSGIESVVEISSQNRVRRGVSVAAICTLMEAGRL